MAVFTLPSLGSDMETGTLVEWLVSPGDSVRRGDVVAVIETQKGAIEIECYEDGIVHDLLADSGTELPVGAPLAILLAPGELPPDDAFEPVSSLAMPHDQTSQMAVQSERLITLPAGDVPASPAARLLARELQVDLKGLSGSFPGGGIVLADVKAAAARSPSAPLETASGKDEMRNAIAASMTRSKRSIPHFYVSNTIDVQPAMDWLEDHNRDVSPADRILLGAVFVRAAVLAAEKTQTFNGIYVNGAFEPSAQVNASVAVALRGGGLIAPALINAHRMSLSETMAGMRDLVTRTRAGRLRNSELTQGTITVSSLGETGAEAMAGVIFPPQVALLCLGAPQIRPWVVDGKIVPRHVATVTLSADHRVNDGRQAARFIAEFENRIEDPENL